MKTVGSRAEVFHGTAKKTSGGLFKKDLKKNKRGRIVSKKMSKRAKKEKRLEKAGFKTKKGKFTLFDKKKKGGSYELYEKCLKDGLDKLSVEELKVLKEYLNNTYNNLYKHATKPSGFHKREKLAVFLKRLGLPKSCYNTISVDRRTSRVLIEKINKEITKKEGLPPYKSTPHGGPPKSRTPKTKPKRRNNNWLNSSKGDLKKLSKLYNVNFAIFSDEITGTSKGITYKQPKAFEIYFTADLKNSGTIWMKFNGRNHYDFMGISESDFINDLQAEKNLFSPLEGFIQVPDGNRFFNYLMNQKLFVLKSLDDSSRTSVSNVLKELGNELPLTVGDGKCGWYAVLIGLSILNDDYSDIIYNKSSKRLSYNVRKTCAFQKNIISNIPTGGKGRKYKIYTGSRGGRYYKRKGKKIYI